MTKLMMMIIMPMLMMMMTLMGMKGDLSSIEVTVYVVYDKTHKLIR